MRSPAHRQQENGGNRQKVGFAQTAPLQQILETIARPVDHAIEMQLREAKCLAELLLAFLIEVEPHEELAVTGERYLLKQLLYQPRPLVCFKFLYRPARLGALCGF